MSSPPPSPGKQEETGRRDELTELLADVEWMRSRLHAGGVAGLLTDYTSIPDQPELALVQETILLSAHALVVDPDQLPAQLAGRTIGRCEPARARLHAVARAWPHAAWLCPIQPTLAQPGGALRRTLTGHTGMVLGVAVSADGRTAVSGSWDRTVRVWDLADGREHVCWIADAGIQAVAVNGTITVAGDTAGQVHALQPNVPAAASA